MKASLVAKEILRSNYGLVILDICVIYINFRSKYIKVFNEYGYGLLGSCHVHLPFCYQFFL